jgi:hypothetical protein
MAQRADIEAENEKSNGVANSELRDATQSKLVKDVRTV